jgi:transposase
MYSSRGCVAEVIFTVDNCSIHHNRAERVLDQFFGFQGVQYAFLLTYSPDLNPVGNGFGQIKKYFIARKISSNHFSKFKTSHYQCYQRNSTN